LDFVKNEHKKAISKDAWQQLFHFMTTYPKNLTEYDSNTSSWPLMYDSFYEWSQEGKSEEKKRRKTKVKIKVCCEFFFMVGLFNIKMNN